MLDGARIVDCLLSPGCLVAGKVERSVLGPGVIVEAGATVRNSVVFADTVVDTGATVDWSVVDEGCRIRAGAVVGDPAAGCDDPDGVTIVGRDSSVDTDLGAAARLEPGTTG